MGQIVEILMILVVFSYLLYALIGGIRKEDKERKAHP
jgi:hypothetical protein